MSSNNPLTTSTVVQQLSTTATLWIPGTELNLTYDSSQYAGDERGRVIEIPLGDEPIDDLVTHVVEIEVAGQHHRTLVSPTESNYRFVWDGRDGQGRRVQGTATASIRVGNRYDGVYASPSSSSSGSGGGGGGGSGSTGGANVSGGGASGAQSFARMPTGTITGTASRQSITLWREYERDLRYTDPAPLGFGGWTANLQRDPLELDERRQRASTEVVEAAQTGGGTWYSAAVGPDGRLYQADADGGVIAIDRDVLLIGTLSLSDDEYALDASQPWATRIAAEGFLTGIQDLAVGPAGAVFVAGSETPRSPEGSVVVRIDPADGSVTTVAGTGERPREAADVGFEKPYLIPNDALGVATKTPIRVRQLAVGPEGSVHFVERSQGTAANPDMGAIRRISQSGRIVPVAGDPGNGAERGDPSTGEYTVVPTEAAVRPQTLVVDDDGVAYFADGSAGYPEILAATPTGTLRHVAGRYSGFRAIDDGTTAEEAQFGEIAAMALSPAGEPIVLDATHDVVYVLATDGGVYGLLGSGRSDDPWLRDGDRATAGRWAAHDCDWIDVAGDGTVLFDGDLRDTPWAIGRVRTSLDEGQFLPSPDGRWVHTIPERHDETVDALTGATKWRIEYDEGRASAFVDAHGNRTTVERADDGPLQAIEAPGGERTTFELGQHGYVSTATLPDGREISFEYTNDGLLTRAVDAAGNATTFGYDEVGRVTQRTDPTGGVTDLVRDETTTSREVTRVSPEMREVTHTSQRDGGDLVFWTTCCGGTESSTTITTRGEWQISRAGGGSRTLVQGPDPRFGMLAPVTTLATETSPGGRESTVETERTVSLTDPVDPLSVATATDTVTVDGRTFERSYDASTDELTLSTPMGRPTVLTYDGDGEVVELSTDGVAPVSLSRDDDGRLAEVTQAGTTTTFERAAGGSLSAVTDASGRRVEFERDATGRLTSVMRAAGTDAAATHDLAYDAADALTGVTRPNGDVHAFDHDAAGRLTSYVPPEDGGSSDGDGSTADAGYSVTYDGDGLVTALDPPSGRTVENVHDAGGRKTSASHPDATVSYTRDAAGRATEITRTPADGGTDQTLSIERDGRAITALEYGGAVAGRFEYAHDANGWVTEIVDPDGTSHALTHDDDGLATTYGDFSLARDGPDGAPTEITDGTLTITYTYDDRGRVATRTHEVGGTTAYAVEYDYDGDGRIAERTETVAETDRPAESFAYTDAGRLAERSVDGATVESFEYDANGNRTARTVGATTLGARFLAGDRIDERDAPSGGGTTTVAYDHDVDGFVTGRGGDAFTYSATGELLSSTLADGTTVSCVNDGHGRLVGRTVGGETTEYLYGDPSRPWQPTVVRDPDGTRTRYFHDPNGRVVAFDRDGTRHYVATDQVGSPRVVAAADGTVEREVERDAYGAVTSDSAPDATLHVGFASGIRDPATGLIRFGVRDYDPAAGRFLARDPILMAGGQWNFYAYADGDPINRVDRNGLSWSCWWNESLEDYNTTMDNIGPVKNLIDAASGPKGFVKGKALEHSTGVGGIPGAAAVGGMTAGWGGATTASALAKGALRSAGGAAGVQLSLQAGAAAGAGINNLWDRSLSDRIASGLMDWDPLGRKTVEDSPSDGGSGDCGEKDPENC